VTTALIIVAASAAALWFSLLAGYLYLAMLPTRRARTRPSRRGGYVRPLVFEHTKDGGQRAPATATTVPISSSGLPGRAWVDAAHPQMLPPPNRLTVPIWSGSAMGVPGVSGARALAQRVGSTDEAA